MMSLVAILNCDEAERGRGALINWPWGLVLETQTLCETERVFRAYERCLDLSSVILNNV